MLLTGNNSIKEVILFPSMKNVQPGEEEATEGTMQEKLGTI
jgi:aspartyl-tRNA synthetase